jgi:hypothetical protein
VGVKNTTGAKALDLCTEAAECSFDASENPPQNLVRFFVLAFITSEGVMKKILAAVACAVALVGCGPMDEAESATSAQQDALVQPDGLPTGSTLDHTQLALDQQAAVQARNAQFADQYVWGMTERPHGCHK